jgi:hypothetical protein
LKYAGLVNREFYQLFERVQTFPANGVEAQVNWPGTRLSGNRSRLAHNKTSREPRRTLALKPFVFMRESRPLC